VSCQIILDNKAIWKLMLSKNVNNKKCAPKFVLFSKNLDDFWHRKLTLKVIFRHFFTSSHYTNSQNSMISFDYSSFLANNLSNFVSLPWKLHNRYCHSPESYWSNNHCYINPKQFFKMTTFLLKMTTFSVKGGFHLYLFPFKFPFIYISI
jgi:hypothetical protein